MAIELKYYDGILSFIHPCMHLTTDLNIVDISMKIQQLKTEIVKAPRKSDTVITKQSSCTCTLNTAANDLHSEQTQ